MFLRKTGNIVPSPLWGEGGAKHRVRGEMWIKNPKRNLVFLPFVEPLTRPFGTPSPRKGERGIRLLASLFLLPLFGVMTWRLYDQHERRVTRSEQRLLDIELTERTGTRFYGLFYGEKQTPLGYSMKTTLPEQDGGTRQDSLMVVKLKVLGRPQDVETVGSVYTNSKGQFTRFDFRLNSPAGGFYAEGRVDRPEGPRRRMSLKVSSTQGMDRRLTLNLPPDMIFYDEIPRYILSRSPKGGEVFTFTVLDPANLAMATLRAEVKGWRKTPKGQRVLRVRYIYKGVPLDMTLDRYGDVLSEQSTLGFFSKRISFEEVQALARNRKQLPDIAQLTAIHPTGKAIRDSFRVVTAHYRVSGVPLSRFNAMAGRGQELVGGELWVHPAIPRSDQGLTAQERRHWLAPTVLVQSRDPAITTLARRLTRGAAGEPAVRRILSYVYQGLEKMPVVSLPSAVDILRDRKGDCNEHATLFAALTRAAGVPTRVVGGVVMLRGVFLFHAWNEVFVNGHWLSADATLGQMPTDATHLRFMEGRDVRALSPLMNLVGQGRIEILYTEEKP